MKNFKFLAIALAATTIFAACSKDSNSTEVPTPNGNKKVVVSFVNGVKDTRSSVGKEVEKYEMKFTDGMLYFTKADGTVTHKVEIAANAAAGGIEAADLNKKTHTFTVSNETEYVYIVGNLKNGYPTVGNVKTDLFNEVLEMASQTDLDKDKGVDLVTLYGGDMLTLKEATATEEVYEAKVKVKPIGSRIEIHQFEAVDEVGKEITSYQIDGIFLNNLYTQSYITGKKTGDVFSADAAAAESFALDSEGGEYAAADNGLYFDYAAAGVGAAIGSVYAPEDANVWSYNLFAPTDAVVAFPNIVVRVSDVESANITGETDPRWLVVKELTYANDTDNASAGDVIASLEAGKIYKIKNFKFTEDDLKEDLEELTVTAEVEVELIDWEEIELIPEL